MSEHKRMPQQFEGRRVTSMLTALPLFMLFAEWLRPLAEMAQITDLHLIRPFLAAIGCFVFVEYIALPALLSWSIRLMLCMTTVIYLFHTISSKNSGEIGRYMGLAVKDGAAFLHGQFGSLSPEGRTFLFLLGWALFVSLVYSGISYKRNGYWFVICTVIYLIGLQLWPGLDTNIGLVRALAAGLLLLALLNLPRIEMKYDLPRKMAVLPTSWVAVSVVLVAAVVAAGLFASKSQPREVEPLAWIDELPYLKSAFGDHAETAVINAAVGRTGYGEDDSRLGGSLVPDNKIVFIARTDRLTYWRGESKMNYDGKGWTQPETDVELQNVDLPVPGRNPASETGESAAESPTITQEVLLSDNKQDIPLFTGGPISSFVAVVTTRGHMLSGENVMVDRETGKYSLQPGLLLSYYKVQVRPQTEDENALRIDNLSYPQQFDSQYLQLPAKIPDRVKRLAEDIVDGQTNNYDRVKAVESYLREHYTYDLGKPEYPNSGEDFVDHFLFKQKLGYCDHFSTAMAVLLRSVGIPARWVKGFAPGEASDNSSSEAGMATSPENLFPGPGSETSPGSKPLTVTVRNVHAHSWVEVYFPRHGWIPFEPTPGFHGVEEKTGTAQTANADQGTVPPSAAAGTALPKSQPTRDAEMHNEQLAEERISAAESLGRKSSEWLNHAVDSVFLPLMKALKNIDWRKAAFATAALSLLAGAFWLCRRRLLLWILLRNYHRSGRKAELAVNMLDRLWLIAFRTYGRKQKHHTLREYVECLSFQDENRRQALVQFLELYENMRYGGSQRSSLSRKMLTETWSKINS